MPSSSSTASASLSATLNTMNPDGADAVAMMGAFKTAEKNSGFLGSLAKEEDEEEKDSSKATNCVQS